MPTWFVGESTPDFDTSLVVIGKLCFHTEHFDYKLHLPGLFDDSNISPSYHTFRNLLA
jgi:hypothetical protein